ncbi:saccharopine dehydrogenase family protein [Nonomuraea lactucae]|uniref:saccharopine dehydrogenase family protein n=1 Tax=Nonomuraea lactucae TaxID=2249762 RepID=UPI00196266CE|nr:saccharopine dehydrogenase NADP-binding domain-containing protein [Nonomuraea lactucae]
MRRDFDFVVWGASGHTGRLIAERLAAGAHGWRWALGGRSESRLRRVHQEIGAPAEVELVVADADDEASLRALVGRTGAVISAAGPYQLHGSQLLRMCAQTGTDYLDLCGEPIWMRQMIDRFEGDARRSGARVIFSCGYDSVPFETGVDVLQSAAMKRWGAPLPRVSARVEFTDVGGFSAGTLASLRATADAARAGEAVQDDPYLLTPGFSGPRRPQPAGPHFDERLGVWAAPYVLAPINVGNLHRSNGLRGHAWGEDFTYDEMLVAGPGEGGRQVAEAITAAMAAITAPGASAADDPPAPPAGPSPSYRISFHGSGDGRALNVTVQGVGVPGYDASARMIVEAARTLAQDVPDAPAGIWTPGSLLGEPLTERLSRQGILTYEIAEPPHS